MFNSRIDRPEEVLLSYLTGLAPVGNMLEAPLAMTMGDLGIKHRSEFYRFLNRLIRRGAVRRVACGVGGTTGLLVVLKRPEQAFPQRPDLMSERVGRNYAWRSKNKWADFRARLMSEVRV